MKLAMIGPVYPFRGGISHFTSQLAKELINSGHSVDIFSFRRQYPGSIGGPHFGRLLTGALRKYYVDQVWR
jgi:hypothetical protein